MWSKKSAAPSAEETTPDGERLPPGWTRKESKSQKGRYYYISPAGKTQWTPPITKEKREKIQTNYNWVHEIEIEFGEGRLGVSLREVRQLANIPYPQFQAEVDDLPKVNGKAGPAELYNWSVKPHKRLTIGMRITSIESTSLAGLTYKEVVDKLKRSSRPLKLKFADVEKGTIEDNPDAAREQEEREAAEAKPSAYLVQKQEYTRVLVTGELHTEMWLIENKKLTRQMNVAKKKWETVSTEFDGLNQRRLELRKENEKLTSEKQKYETMIKQLKMQEDHVVGNPEFVKANDLARRNTELTDDIAKMESGNKRLRKEQVTLQMSLDELLKEVAKLDKGKTEEDNDDDIFFGIDPNATPAEQLAALRKKARYMEDDIVKEQRKAIKVEKEMDQLNKHLANLTGSSPSSSSSERPSKDSSSSKESSSRSSGGRSKPTSEGKGRDSGRKMDGDATGSGRGELPSDPAALEARIQELRKKQRSVVETLSKAAKEGDQKLARECQKKRKSIKDELRRAQDALNLIKAGSEPTAKSSSKSRSNSTTSGRQGKVISAQEVQKSKPAEKMPTKTGFLDKGPTEWSERGLIKNMKTMRGARERWCEVTPDGFLKYYKRRGDPVVRGEIDLSDASFEVTMEGSKEFVLCTSAQQSHFFTRTPQELQSWVKVLRGANAYLKTNKQLDALASKIDAADRRGGKFAPEEDGEFYGRATLGF
ncbi:hypothetical protein Poli38472_003558 [Pythium oligandrum]|uniref:WW domain-containing protein n=1 Tax=Pythium oligandrum TaxID=41045 RepID=A0A8K1C739_PYTOL|nr:hypothetical protein Poli38472_003558 [Pythium oligandrum]|eukprot:TMW57633.1 hypothetical protein Poli38472_003558 [Pythium oligandrum]